MIIANAKMHIRRNINPTKKFLNVEVFYGNRLLCVCLAIPSVKRPGAGHSWTQDPRPCGGWISCSLAISEVKPAFLPRMNCPNEAQKILKHFFSPANSDRSRNLKALQGDLSKVWFKGLRVFLAELLLPCEEWSHYWTCSTCSVWGWKEPWLLQNVECLEVEKGVGRRARRKGGGKPEAVC